MISFSLAPSNTGVAVFVPGRRGVELVGQLGRPLRAVPSISQPVLAIHPRWVSRTWPMFIRRGTPCVLRMMSTGVPSGRNGMSSAGRILPITPLLPWRPASLSPSWILRFWATYTRTSSFTPGAQLVLVVAGEHPDADDLAVLAVRHLQRGVAHLARLLAEDRAEQALLRGQLRLALGRDLADQDVARLDLGADPDDAALVEVGQHLLGDVRDVPGDLLGAQLGVAGVDLVLLDVDRREHVVLHETLREDDRVLVVVALPRHDRHEQVLAQRHLAVLGARPVGEHLAHLDPRALVHDRLLVGAGALVAAAELVQPVGLAACRRRP